jgi:hypothetical protein
MPQPLHPLPQGIQKETAHRKWGSSHPLWSDWDDTGESWSTQELPLKYRTTIRSAVRVASACVVSVGLGPPIPLAIAELSAMYKRLTQRDSACSSSTELSLPKPIADRRSPLQRG